MTNKPEVWLRGPLPGIIPALQPVAHALLQAREELNELMKDFPDTLLWRQPADLAAAGFHLKHLTGVLDRLFAYAGNKALSTEQLDWLANENNATITGQNVQYLVTVFNEQVDRALIQLQAVTVQTVYEVRAVGRAKMPSTVVGLLVHAAEHTMRHLGQLLVTARVVIAQVR